MSHLSYFISYSHSWRPVVDAFAEKLSNLGIKTFLDTKDISIAHELDKSIREGLGRCDGLVVFWCVAAANSEWVSKEVKTFADERPNLPIFIVKLDHLRPPEKMKDIHYFDAYERCLRSLFAAHQITPDAAPGTDWTKLIKDKAFRDLIEEFDNDLVRHAHSRIADLSERIVALNVHHAEEVADLNAHHARALADMNAKHAQALAVKDSSVTRTRRWQVGSMIVAAVLVALGGMTARQVFEQLRERIEYWQLFHDELQRYRKDSLATFPKNAPNKFVEQAVHNVLGLVEKRVQALIPSAKAVSVTHLRLRRDPTEEYAPGFLKCQWNTGLNDSLFFTIGGAGKVFTNPPIAKVHDKSIARCVHHEGAVVWSDDIAKYDPSHCAFAAPVSEKIDLVGCVPIWTSRMTDLPAAGRAEVTDMLCLAAKANSLSPETRGELEAYLSAAALELGALGASSIRCMVDLNFATTGP